MYRLGLVAGRIVAEPSKLAATRRVTGADAPPPGATCTVDSVDTGACALAYVATGVTMAKSGVAPSLQCSEAGSRATLGAPGVGAPCGRGSATSSSSWHMSWLVHNKTRQVPLKSFLELVKLMALACVALSSHGAKAAAVTVPGCRAFRRASSSSAAAAAALASRPDTGAGPGAGLPSPSPSSNSGGARRRGVGFIGRLSAYRA